ncbi:hypothetical protein Sjap_000522 [Stephania japonica]|uniref:Peptide N-acetyl-beta-D-glucosaminyl asparaginase amidase A N-terminal domain-containing protein n=1 Tax=Stephania japonica TaxID=461633 RepID=A0AAP0KI78_9MAGN
MAPLLLFTLSLLLLPFTPSANLHNTKTLLSQLDHTSHQNPQQDTTPITTFFQVTKPIKTPQKSNPCSLLVLQHDFASTFGKPPVLANYTPPTNCPSQHFSKIVLEWKATSKGRQFDRIFGVWLGGVEVLRSCTAEPRATGIVWTVEKDITRYSSLLKSPNEFAVYIGNIVDSTYTGVYHVNLTLHFYPANVDHHVKHKFGGSSNDFIGSPADLIVPISRNLPLNDGQWFLVENSTDVQLKEFEIPRNAYRAVLEVYVSYHENDEFWYGNPPNDYIVGNNLTTTPGNGPFREVLVSLDDVVVGAVWPFTVVYTGGINPLLWRPITAIGSFDLPTYDIEITPFLGKLLDGKQHSIRFEVTNALNVWYIDANLHVWLDAKSKVTEGELTEYKSPPPTFSLSSKFKGLNGTFFTSATRSISSSGWVKSSHGKIMTNSCQDFSFVNSMEIGKNGDLQVVNQNINANGSVFAMLPSSYLYSIQKAQSFPMYLHTDSMDQNNGSFTLVANVSLGFNEKRSVGSRLGFSISSLNNLQNGQGSMVVKGNLVTSGLGSTQQVYNFDGFSDCYFRNVSSSNYTIIYDVSGDTCRGTQKTRPKHGFARWRAFFTRDARI